MSKYNALWEYVQKSGKESRNLMGACSMLKKLDGILNILISSLMGAFVGHAIYVYLDYRTYPGLYDMQSAPWYTGILYYGIFTIVPLIIAVIIKLFL